MEAAWSPCEHAKVRAGLEKEKDKRSIFANFVAKKDDFLGFKQVQLDLGEMSPSSYTVGLA